MIRVVVGAVAVFAASFAQAGQITSAGTLMTNTMGSYVPQFGVSNMTDQSGLSAHYVSGVTDFESFVASGVVHTGGDYTSWVSPAHVSSGYFTFDLGATYNLSKFVMWNGTYGLNASVNGFSISTSNVSDFSTFTDVGIFTGNQQHYGATVYDLQDTSARYVKLSIRGNFGSAFTGVGDIAFDTTVSAVPEPETYALMLAGLGLVGAVARRRQHQSMAA